ncbi:MAG: hypothetical protein QOI12_757, partial [Alphaproteobacteria bacterium]|nr:hypothetical protein [Alphaproteobacteria bacterium]
MRISANKLAALLLGVLAGSPDWVSPA